jgi:cyclic pyranopterin phosphate synthase
MASQLTDAFARKFFYLRLSITDVCNFRCTYCLPDGYKPGSTTNNGFLSVDEVRRVTRAFTELGTEKVRLTGENLLCVATFPTLSLRCAKTTVSVKLR